jgi:hypothetical protein
MTCPCCNKPVAPGQLVCACFIQHAENETRELALRRFASDEQPLLLVLPQHAKDAHLAIKRRNAWTLCRRFRCTDLKAIPIDRAQLAATKQMICEQCKQTALVALTGAAVAGRSPSVGGGAA